VRFIASPDTEPRCGHHQRSLARFDFDSVLLPFNFITMQLPYYAENFEALVADVQGAKRRRADHQVDRPTAVA